MNIESMASKYMWVEKYRPRELEDVILPDEYRKTFNKYIEDKEIPHLLFYGGPGSGKSTVARILIDKILKNSADVMKINGSSKTGVDVMRDQVEDFLRCKSFGSKFKIVFIDEADYLSNNSQAALRNIFESFYKNGRFLMTCNYPHKFIEGIFSRCQDFEFKNLQPLQIKSQCNTILKSENIEYDEKDVEKIISTYYPDIRKIVGFMNSKALDGKLEFSSDDLKSNESKVKVHFLNLIKGIKTKDRNLLKESLENISQITSSSELDYISLYKDLFENAISDFFVKVLINDYIKNHNDHMIPSMNFMAFLYAVIKAYAEKNKITNVKV